jgi:hypothetical protein
MRDTSSMDEIVARARELILQALLVEILATAGGSRVG